jgi:hypothetical protein
MQPREISRSFSRWPFAVQSIFSSRNSPPSAQGRILVLSDLRNLTGLHSSKPLRTFIGLHNLQLACIARIEQRARHEVLLYPSATRLRLYGSSGKKYLSLLMCNRGYIIANLKLHGTWGQIVSFTSLLRYDVLFSGHRNPSHDFAQTKYSTFRTVPRTLKPKIKPTWSNAALQPMWIYPAYRE